MQLISSIRTDIAFPGRQQGGVWFHPRACMVPTPGGPLVFMTVQGIWGSDVFGHVHSTTSTDAGHSWSEPQPIPGFGRTDHGEGLEVGVCDVVPSYHAATGAVLAMGHSVWYQDDVLTKAGQDRYPVYAAWRPDTGGWSDAQRLEFADPLAARVFTSGCAQRVHLQDGRLVVPFSLGGAPDRTDRSVCSGLCEFDGERLQVLRRGNLLENPVKRGLLEPSLAHLDDTFYMTIRAEDDRGYVTRSFDGLSWEPQRPWCWDDGEPLTMSTTQQRWVTHSDGLFLVYTRRSEQNLKVMRWRSPLFIAQVDTGNLCLRKNSEQVVLPLDRDGVADGQNAARMGNFHTVNLSPEESCVTVGETRPNQGYKGDTLIGRIRWSTPNKLAAG